MKRGPSMWLCQVCGHEEGWPDGLLSGDVICQACATWALIPRLMIAVEANREEVMVAVVEVRTELQELDNGIHRTDVTLRGVN